MRKYLNEIRKLESEAVALGAIQAYEIKSADEMKYEAWECYQISRIEYLEHLIKDKKIELGLDF